MSTQTEAEVIGELAQQAQDPFQLEAGNVYVVPAEGGATRVLDTDAYGASPRRATAERTVTDAASFVGYLKKHGTESTEVWADTPGSTVVAVIDAHEGADRPAGWEGHKLRLSLEKSKPWLAWVESDGRWFDQLEFADFIEERASDVKEPASAVLLELAQSFQAKRNVDFESSERMQDGQTQLEYKETIAAKAGQKGSIVIPDELLLVLKPYVGAPSYHVFARFRYRLNGAVLKLGYVLLRPQEILDAAFADIVDAIRNGQPERDTWPAHEGITQPIFYGRP